MSIFYNILVQFEYEFSETEIVDKLFVAQKINTRVNFDV